MRAVGHEHHGVLRLVLHELGSQFQHRRAVGGGFRARREVGRDRHRIVIGIDDNHIAFRFGCEFGISALHPADDVAGLDFFPDNLRLEYSVAE